MKKIASVSAVVLLVAAAAAGQSWFKGSLDEAVVQARAVNKKVLLDFYSGG